MPKILSEDDTKEIIKLYKEGKSPKEIGEEFGILNNSVTRLLKNNGIIRNQSKAKKLTDEIVQKIITKYKEGLSTMDISRELGIHDSTVGRILKKNNVEMRDNIRGNAKHKIKEQIDTIKIDEVK